MKRVVLFGIMLMLFCSGCSAKEEPKQEEEQQEQIQAQSTENTEIEDGEDAKTDTETEETDEAGDIQKELAKIEEQSIGYENADWSSMGQADMNQTTAQWYQLWDDELNSLWSRLSDELDAETKAKVLEEQRAWIKQKEARVKGAGMEVNGGSLQPQLENTVAEEITRARAYILAGYLADVRKESFSIPLEIQKSLDASNLNLDDVFAKFEGQWIFDESRGACVGVAKSEDCDYGVKGSSWTVWVTGGGILSDLDVYGYTEDTIIFKIERDGYDDCYELSFDQSGALNLAYGTSLDVMDDVIVCH